MNNYCLKTISPSAALDLKSAEGPGVSDKVRIQKVAKAMEAIFVGQLTTELGKGIEGSDDAKDASPYQDFIQQAMTEGVNKGGGLGLSKMIENYLNHGNQTKLAHPDLQNITTTPHAKSVH